jgi:hypothetical protein
LFPIEEERMASQKGGHAMIEDVIFPFPTRRESGENILPLFKMDTPRKSIGSDWADDAHRVHFWCIVTFGFDRKCTQHTSSNNMDAI